MNADPAFGESSRRVVDPSSLQNDAGVLVAWSAGIGDDEKSHVVHVGPDGLTWALGFTKPAEFGQLVGEAAARPTEAAQLIAAHRSGRQLARDQLARVWFTETLGQFTIHDTAGKAHKIPSGGKGEQARIFAALEQHVGGAATLEDADAWSVIKAHLLGLLLTFFVGGLMIYLAANSDPNYQATGRRSGMKQMINWLGYTVGPVWTSVIVGAFAAVLLALMMSQLMKRPQRKVLTF